MAEDGDPIAYTALTPGVPVVTRSGRQFGTLERVLDDPGTDIFVGIVVATGTGELKVARDQVDRITSEHVVCGLSDAEVAALPPAPPEPEPDLEDAPGRLDFLSSTVPFEGPVSLVRCSGGALFQTVWIPFMSFKAIRWGPHRLQWCPVHEHREWVERVDPRTLTPSELAQASLYPPDRIP